MVDKELIRAKINHLQKSLSRLKEKQSIDKQSFLGDLDAQDIILHNLQLSIQGCIDIASHIVSDEGWELPGTLGGLFDTLAAKKVIDSGMAETMWRVVGMRNIIVHEYEEIDFEKIYAIYTEELGIFDDFVTALIDHFRI